MKGYTNLNGVQVILTIFLIITIIWVFYSLTLHEDVSSSYIGSDSVTSTLITFKSDKPFKVNNEHAKPAPIEHGIYWYKIKYKGNEPKQDIIITTNNNNPQIIEVHTNNEHISANGEQILTNDIRKNVTVNKQWNFNTFIH